MVSTNTIPDINDVRKAASRVGRILSPTPVMEFEQLNELKNARVLLKCETLHPVGAFKIRGAWNFMSQLSADELRRGVIAYSSGNHAQAVAWVARKLNTSATIIMPSDAPNIKKNNTRRYNANVVLYDRQSENREQIADHLAKDLGAIIVPPYDHPKIIAGQGTVGLEIVEQCTTTDTIPDVLVTPCSGGGLVSGCSIPMKDAFPDIRIFSAEPAAFDDTRKSLEEGKRLSNQGNAKSICDALLAKMPGELTFKINQRNLEGGITVSDAKVREAMRTIFSVTGLVVEPAGAIGLAATLQTDFGPPAKTICVVLSGRNVDPLSFAEILAAKQPA